MIDLAEQTRISSIAYPTRQQAADDDDIIVLLVVSRRLVFMIF